MSQRRSSILLRVMSPTSTHQRFSIAPVSSNESEISNLSFKRWHKRMQQAHELQSGKTFWLWKWCRTGCKPCRWFDSIDYEKKICKCCLKFRTFKSLVTIILIAVFFYIFMYSIFKKELLPGGTIFFIFLMCLAAYLIGNLLMYAGMPPMIGHLVVGLTFGNLPSAWLPEHDEDVLLNVTKILEKALLLLALIRAGLLLDLARIKGRFLFIIRVSLFPLTAEFILVLISCHFLLELPWSWSAVQGSVLSIVSLASVTSVMEKNRQTGYGEDKHLSTVLIASSALCVIFGMFTYITCICIIFPSEGYNNEAHMGWRISLDLLLEILLGLGVGMVSGLLISFFPDKRSSEAAVLRIVLTGIGCFAIANILNESGKLGAAVLAVITLCIVATNMWEELGWHQETNPVQYFYTLIYYFGQPAVLSLVGFTMNFQNSHSKDIGLSIAVIAIGLIGRETVCFATTLGPMYQTTKKEKLYICIAWFSKGTFQALLAFATENMTHENSLYLDVITMESFLKYAKRIKQTTILAILLTTPLACYGLTLLTPVLLTKKERSVSISQPRAVVSQNPPVVSHEESKRTSAETDSIQNKTDKADV